ncbi:RloB family protein [Actinotignum sanguinis]|uniref:RloB family protein n=1 Tax=Actinotignum sanguinis TaxID=1445614 RepID=UPI00254A8B66|nr:RloB family protein [Actinotignum sanguinis]MDK7196807.1 RloB family protein [Actinotignum sanguinis]
MARKRPPRHLRESYLIVTEGSVTEVEYFGLFQQLIRDNRSVTLKIVSGGGEPKRVLDKAMSIAGHSGKYQHICLVMDTDQHPTLQAVMKDAQKEGFEVFVSNPCFEIWLWWHIADHFADVSPGELEKKLVPYLDGKSVPGTFPVVLWRDAYERAKNADKRNGEVGLNPSSQVGELLTALTFK